MVSPNGAVSIRMPDSARSDDIDTHTKTSLLRVHKVASGDPTALPAQQALAMATRLGAGAVRLGDSVGQLKVGMQADIIQLQLGATHQQPLYDVVSHLVYVMDSTDVVTTVVAGKVLMQDRQVQTIDEQALRQSVAKTSNEIRAALREAKAPASE